MTIEGDEVVPWPAPAGSRYGLKLSNKSPDSFKRMRVILGYYDLPTSLKSEEPSVESVNISTLQTLKYLPLARDLKKRLLDYKTISLNRYWFCPLGLRFAAVKL